MPDFTVSRPLQLVVGAATPSRLDVLVATHDALNVYTPGASASLVVSDSATLTDGTPILSVPHAALQTGQSYPLGVACSNGLAVEQIPPGVAVRVFW
jgi:hypothetical protein